MDLKNCVVVLISRSGTTTETLWALEKTRKQLSGTRIVTITVRPTSPLARNSDYVIAAPAADEKSVAQTRSFTSMHICAQVFIEHLYRKTPNLVWLEELPGNLEKLLDCYLSFGEHVGRDLTIERFIFLGGGSFYGIACEAMLKTKELAITWSEAYHPFELRHGPMSIVDPHSMIIGLISDQHQDAEIQVLKEMKRLGAKTLAITNNARSTDCSEVDDVLEIDSKLRDWQRGALYLPSFNGLASTDH